MNFFKLFKSSQPKDIYPEHIKLIEDPSIFHLYTEQDGKIGEFATKLVGKMDSFVTVGLKSILNGLCGTHPKRLFLSDPDYSGKVSFEMYCLYYACIKYFIPEFIPRKVDNFLFKTLKSTYSLILSNIKVTDDVLEKNIVSRLHIYNLLLEGYFEKKMTSTLAYIDSLLFDYPFSTFQNHIPKNIDAIEIPLSLANLERKAITINSILLFTKSITKEAQEYYFTTDLKKHIIHLDDHKIYQNGLKQSIDPSGKRYNLTQFNSSKEAVNYISSCFQKNVQIDLIISDINHDEINGYKFGEIVTDLKLKYHKNTPLLIISMTVPQHITLSNTDEIENKIKNDSTLDVSLFKSFNSIKEYLNRGHFSSCMPKNSTSEDIAKEIERLISY